MVGFEEDLVSEQEARAHVQRIMMPTIGSCGEELRGCI